MSQTDQYDVEAFLNNLFAKISISKIIFEDRKKNSETLLELGIAPNQRIDYIQKLEPMDYISGPTDDEFGGTPLWVFGKIIYHKEIYIKIQLNFFNNPVICISFHIAEHPLEFAFK